MTDRRSGWDGHPQQSTLEGLERERASYEARRRAAAQAAERAVTEVVKAGKAAEAEQLADRIAQVDEQIKHYAAAGAGE